MCYNRPNLWLAHSSVQNVLPSNALGPNRVSPAPALIQWLEPQAGASAERPAEAKPALSATCLPCADTQAGRGLLTRSGNAAFRRQPPQTAQAGRGLLTAPTPDPSAARFDVAQVAKSGCVDACLPATAPSAGGHQTSHSEKFDNSLSLNDPPNRDPPNIGLPVPSVSSSALRVFFHPALRIRVLPSLARDPTTVRTRLLTHGRQFGEKNEESADERGILHSAFFLRSV